jgi:hypothetical protein
MAMHKEPRLRYESAGQLSEDLRRYLENLPVMARSPTVRYRAGKSCGATGSRSPRSPWWPSV